VVEHKDVVLGVLASSAALAGLVLVFLGLVIAAYAGLKADDPRSVKRPYRQTGAALAAAFIIGLVCVALGSAWLIIRVGHDNDALYVATLVAFGVQLVALIGSTIWTLGELLWD